MTNSHHRPSGHSAVRTAKIRVHDTNAFVNWYFQEYGVCMPRDVEIAFRTDFNVGWKGRKRFVKKNEENK